MAMETESFGRKGLPLAEQPGNKSGANGGNAQSLEPSRLASMNDERQKRIAENRMRDNLLTNLTPADITIIDNVFIPRRE